MVIKIIHEARDGPHHDYTQTPEDVQKYFDRLFSIVKGRVKIMITGNILCRIIAAVRVSTRFHIHTGLQQNETFEGRCAKHSSTT